MSNDLKGSEEMKTPSVRVHEGLLGDFDEWADEAHGSRSKAMRALMRDAIGTSAEPETPLHPPDEDHLARAYQRLHMAASRDGVVTQDRALTVCSGGSEHLTKAEVPDLVLRPLQQRGYLKRQGDFYGSDAWRLVGWSP